MIIGSLCVTAGAVVIGLPIGLLTAIYLSRFCPEKLHKALEPLVQLMAGIPSIIYGFFGLVVMVPLARNLHGCTRRQHADRRCAARHHDSADHHQSE